jgi:hypothetical protein
MNEMGRVYSTLGEKQRYKTTQKMGDWMHLAHDKDQWWVLVKMVVDLQVP